MYKEGKTPVITEILRRRIPFISYKTRFPIRKTITQNPNSLSETLIRCRFITPPISPPINHSIHRQIQTPLSSSSSTAAASSSGATSPVTPPTKRVRRSSRRPENNKKVENDKNDVGLGDSDLKNKIEIMKCDVSDSLQICCYVIHMCVTHPENVFSVTNLLRSVQELHDNSVVFELESSLLSDIASLCEEWWKRDLLGRDSLISQSLPFLLSKSLTLKKKVDVHRVYGLREAFALFDFEDESIEDLKLLLIRCLISPLFLKMDEGRRFLAFLFGLSRQLVKESLAMIRSQIPFVTNNYKLKI